MEKNDWLGSRLDSIDFDVVKQRLIKYFGYNETSATDVLNYVASIFARGDAQQEEED